MRREAFRAVRLFFVPLAVIGLVGCQPIYEAIGTHRTQANPDDAGLATSEPLMSAGLYQHVGAEPVRIDAERQYQSVLDWFGREGLQAHSHEELVELAASDTSAAQYVACHEASKDPQGNTTRLQLLSDCLANDAAPDTMIATATL